MKKVNNVFETTDYSFFKKIKGNRDVNLLHVKRLKDSFKKEGYLMAPIIVNENGEVIDGQHRLESAMELNLPIRYIICDGYGLKEIQALNTNMKNWGKIEYLNAFCDLGYPNYIAFRQFMEDYPDFGIAACEVILTDTLTNNATIRDKSGVVKTASKNYTARSFENGDLKIPDYAKSVDNAEKILQIKPYYVNYNRSVFVRAILGVFRNENYSHDVFLARLKANPTAMKDCANVTQYKDLIEEIYNFRSRIKVNLRY
jgi:hypothetical protein